jgi:hypothetical protein
MSTDLTRVTNQLPAMRPSRQLMKGLGRIGEGTSIGLARIDQKVDLQIGRVEGLAAVGGVGLQAVAATTQLEQQLTQMVPLAASRLEAIGNMIALGITGVIADTTRQLL